MGYGAIIEKWKGICNSSKCMGMKRVSEGVGRLEIVSGANK
jgi:hypothetical protein